MAVLNCGKAIFFVINDIKIFDFMVYLKIYFKKKFLLDISLKKDNIDS